MFAGGKKNKSNNNETPPFPLTQALSPGERETRLSVSLPESALRGSMGKKPPEFPTPLKEFLGLKVRSRLGIAAGILLNSKWVAAYAGLGFDVLTYKTVRSSHRPCYAF